MHRPLRVPFYLRVWNLIKGILFYNTVNWHKASDGLNMPSLTRHERESKRPKADLEIIKPREKPRARLDSFRGAEISSPEPPPAGALSLPPQISEPDDSEETSEKVQRADGTYIKRRRYKRRRGTSNSGSGNSFFRRVFGK